MPKKKYKQNKEHIEKTRLKNLGKKRSDASIERYKISNKNKNKGIKRTNEFRLRVSEQKSGRNNPNFGRHGEDAFGWKGGNKTLSALIRNSKKYIAWRINIMQRDKYTCCVCHQIGGKLEVHHIKKFSILLKENNIKTLDDAMKCKELWDISIAVTLCKDCHKLTPNYKNKT